MRDIFGAPCTAIAITGGAGAVGGHFIRHVLTHTSLPVRALIHKTPLPLDLDASRIVQLEGSLLDAASLDRWLCPGAAVVHLAWSASMSEEDHLRSVAVLANSVGRQKCAHLVHCSTAVVAGRVPASVVTEDTRCEPITDYERIKYKIELTIEAAAAGRVPLTVLRPTAVFGPGLKNLISLIESLRAGPTAITYLRTLLMGSRHLHLVPVETVCAALLFAAQRGDAVGHVERSRYIVSSDQEPGGDLHAIETRVRRILGLGAAPPSLPVPRLGLKAILKAAGRSDTDPHRVYDGSRLRHAGFVPPLGLGEAVDRYVAWYMTSLGERDAA